MNRLAIGLGVRFFNEMATIGGAFIRSRTGSILICIRPAPNRKVEFGKMATNRPLSTSRLRHGKKDM
jgi:hypothetical protein